MKKRGGFSVAFLLCILYAISGSFAILLENSYDYKAYDFNLIDVIAYCTLLTLTILPFIKKYEGIVDDIKMSNHIVFNVYCYIVIISSIIVISRTEFSLSSFLMSDYGEIRSDFYRQMNENKEGGDVLFTILRIFSGNFAVNLACFFYSFTFLNKRNVFNVLLLFATTAPVIEDVATGSRTTAVYWILLFVAFFIFFRKYWPTKKLRIAYILIGFFAFLMIAYVSVVTITRFSLGVGVEDSLISYIGQPFLQFSVVWNQYELPTITTDRLLPLTSKYLFGHTGFNVHEYRDWIEMKTSVPANVFYTYIGDTIIDIGRIGAVLFVLFYYIIALKLIKIKKVIHFEDLIVYTILLRFPLHGIFAYVYYTTTTSLGLILSLSLYLALKYSRSK